MALLLRTRRVTNPRLVQLFSSSSSSSSSDSTDGDDVKASLRQNPPLPLRKVPPPPPPPKEFPSFSSIKPSSSSSSSFDEIRKNLSEFRRRSSVPPPPPDNRSSSQTISFQELYKRNVIEKNEQTTITTGGNPKRENSFESIRESLRQLRSSTANQSQNDRFRGGGQDYRGNNRTIDPYSLKSFKDSLKMRPDGSDSGGNQSMVLGGSEVLPSSVFGKELRPKSESESQAMKTEFVKMYTYGELGEKLAKLRPLDNTKGFSLEELNDRLRKLREMEEKEMDSRIGGVLFKELRESLVKMTDDKTKKSTMHRLDLLGHIGGTPSFMMHPPKEELVEKYFHPDNMSSEEKLKLELQKVRDEFKMSESDCGSSRVQVAQLTVKIKHLSSVLHKKDKHSRKGLQAMVQRRKKLLRYLRRTDWDSFCLVLSKLGLRDNPDYKN